MRTNAKRKPVAYTHEGAPAKVISPLHQLRRSVMSCLLFEKEFYEDGIEIADRLADLAGKVAPHELARLAVEARSEANLRHAPLYLARLLCRHASGGHLAEDTIAAVIQRADEIAEFVALYMRDGKQPLSAQAKRGLAKAFAKFDEYQFQKNDRKDAAWRIRDVMFLVKPKPADEAQAALFKRIADDAMQTADTWEVALSAGADKRETFERLLREKKLGYLALLRNLRNMAEAGVDEALIREAIVARKGGAHRVLPFRFVAAARAAPHLEPALDQALCETISEMVPLRGRTVVLVDVSGSMDAALSRRSDLTRMDAAAALASVINAESLRVFSFSAKGLQWGGYHFGRGSLYAHDGSAVLVEVPPRRGMAGIDAVVKSQEHGGTMLGQAVKEANAIPHDRLIVITDEQSHDPVSDPIAKHAYMINVASAQNGVGYGKWTHIDGFSESVIRFIHAVEAESSNGEDA